ncbi:MAG: hypothetical protein FWH26_09935 [Oscillospiraceae bacterium]|nr:hypothetical protein [Oscillospiraceae bacterium]
MKKAIAILLGLILALGIFAACDKNGGETTQPETSTTEAVTETTTEPETSEPETETTEPTDQTETTTEPLDTNVNATTATTGMDDTATTTGAAVPQGTAAILKAYADAVDKSLAANPQVKKVCNTVIAKPLDGDDNIKKLLKIDIAGINVQNKVCEFLGEGNNTYNQSLQEALQKSHLTANDVSSASAKQLANGNIELTINVKNCSDPAKLGEGGSPLGRFTWDYTNVKSVRQGISDAENDVPGLKINIETIIVNYYSISIVAVINPASGRLVGLTHSYRYDARVEGVQVKEFIIPLGKGDWGAGKATGKITYTF